MFQFGSREILSIVSWVVSSLLDSKPVFFCFKKKTEDAFVSVISILVLLFAVHVVVQSQDIGCCFLVKVC